LDMGKSAPKWMTRFSANVRIATRMMAATMITNSRFRRLRSASEMGLEFIIFLFMLLP
jgi:hypothetical protein